MCLAAFALGAHPRWPLVIAANRDEFFARLAAPLGWWADRPELLAGRDLQAGGTWFGLTRAGRLGLLTNVREPGRHDPAAPSRGSLVTDWLASPLSAAEFAARLGSGHNGFNLVTADLAAGAWWALSNRSLLQPMPPGLHAVSNAALNTPWPKTVALRQALGEALARAQGTDDLAERLLTALADARPAPDAELPDTGVGLAAERALSPAFVSIPGDDGRPRYGTRCATVLIREAGGATRVIERSVGADGRWMPAVEHRLWDWPGHNPGL